MTTIIPGTGATIQTDKAEAYLVAAVRLLQSLEKNPVRNPSNLNYCTSTSSDDNSSFTASLNCNVDVTINSGINIIAIEYLAGIDSTIFTNGTDGTFTASGLVQSIFDAAVLLENLELQSIKNPTQANYVSWSISNQDIGGSGQARLSISLLNFPLEITLNEQGDQTTRGKEYLL